jgi:hypothetical protein
VPYPPFPVSSFGSDVVQVVGGFLWSAGNSLARPVERTAKHWVAYQHIYRSTLLLKRWLKELGRIGW